MSLRPILFHIFKKPLPYIPTLALQEQIHALQASSRANKPEVTENSLKSSTHEDVLLLLEHRPVYTAGRRQDAEELATERDAVVRSGADWVSTQRGGETTYHGPGQIVGYNLFDLTRMGVRTRTHVCRVQDLLKTYLETRHQIPIYPSEHTGVFYSSTQKLASIGMQVRHGLTSHGFAVNVTNEPLAWFDQVVACGLADVRAASVQSVNMDMGKTIALDLTEEKEVLARMFGDAYERQIRPVQASDGTLWEYIQHLEQEATAQGDWVHQPKRS